MRCIRALLIAKRSAVQLATKLASHFHCWMSNCGRSISGACCANSQRATFSGMPGAAHGPAKPGQTPPALPKLVSSAGPGWRSTTVTSWPALERYQAQAVPMTPAPRTRTFIAPAFPLFGFDVGVGDDFLIPRHFLGDVFG